MSVTHVAGPAVSFTSLDRVIQRCVVCGDVLEDFRPSCVMVVGGGGGGVPVWPERHLVHVDGAQRIVLGDFGNAPLPDDFCLALVEPCSK